MTIIIIVVVFLLNKKRVIKGKSIVFFAYRAQKDSVIKDL